MRNKVIGVAIWYSQAINVFWATLGFAPVGYFSYRFLPLHWLYGFLAISLGAACLPKSFFIQIQLGTTTAIYHKIGIRTVRKYTQDGSLSSMGLLGDNFILIILFVAYLLKRM